MLVLTSKMKKLFYFLLLGFYGCFPDMKAPPLLKKSLIAEDARIEWSSSSSAFHDSPDRIRIIKGDQIDTVCSANNIADMRFLKNDSLEISFFGEPQRYGRPLRLPTELAGFIITIKSLPIPIHSPLEGR